MSKSEDVEELKSELSILKNEIKELKSNIINLTKNYKKLEILNKLRDLSIEGNKFLRLTTGRLKTRYNKLTKSVIWKEAKDYLIRLELMKSDCLLCGHCNKTISNPKECVLHHIYYNQFYLFEPRNVNFVHYSCHDKIHVNLEDLERNSDMWV